MSYITTTSNSYEDLLKEKGLAELSGYLPNTLEAYQQSMPQSSLFNTQQRPNLSLLQPQSNFQSRYSIMTPEEYLGLLGY